MYNITIFVGMDAHKEIFSLCCYSIEKDEFSHPHTAEADYMHVLSYLASLRAVSGENISLIRGYEAGCLGYTLYHQLTEHDITCVILTPITAPVIKGKKESKRISGMCVILQNALPAMITTLCMSQLARMNR